jgi:lipooligosaccharide transport system ATP-binding protein
MRSTGSKPDEIIVEAKGLKKIFDKTEAVRGISFTVRKGECYGFLGPNGAGKTSTMRIIGCVSPATEGSFYVFGLDPRQRLREIKNRIGVVPQESNLDEALPVEENLTVYARFFNVPSKVACERSRELLEFMQLTEKRDAKITELSGGMKRRLLISRALMSNPELLILDEPTTGLDPQARHLVWDKLFELKRRGVTQIVTTHYMDEAQQLCDRLVVMDRGQILEEGHPGELMEKHIGREVLEMRLPESVIATMSKDDPLIRGFDTYRDVLILYSDDADQLLNRMQAKGVRTDYASVRRSTLEDVFLKLTGRRLVE